LLPRLLNRESKKKSRGFFYRPIIEPLEERALLSTDTWTGLGGTGLWSTPANWDTGTTPAPGDDLVFSTGNVVTNDLPPGTIFHSIQATGTIQGNPIVLTGYISSTSGASINLGITLAANVGFAGSMTVSSVVNCNGFALSAASVRVWIPNPEDPGGGYYMDYRGSITGPVYAGNLSGDWSISGPINLTSNASISGVVCSGLISLNGFDLTLAGTSNGGITGAGNVVIVPSGGTISGNNSYTGVTTVASTASLNGSGAIPGPLIVQNGAQLSPSAGYGAILSTGALTLEPGSTLVVTLAYPPTNPLTYSQVQANGPINLDGATLSLPNNGPVLNQTFVILESTDSIIGNFSGLPDGTVLYIDNKPFQLLYSNGTAGQPSRVVLSNVQNWRDVLTGDFTGDGIADIAGRNFAGQWLVGISTERFAPAGPYNSFTNQLWTTWNPAADWRNVVVGDFNGDGKADIAGMTAGGYWWVAESTGSSFVNTYWGRWSPLATWVDVKVGDFNGDGKDDIVGRYLETGEWWVAESSGSSFTNSLWATWNPNVTWVDVNVGNFAGNKTSDLTGRYLEGGSWWTAVSNGSSFNTSLWAQWNPNVTWVDVKAGDFNNDGKTDLTARFLEGGSWWTALSTGSSFTTTMWAQWNPNVTWVDVQVGDFNGDGKADITGRYLEAGSWWTAVSTGSSFVTTMWTTWDPDVTWVDVRAANFTGSGMTALTGRYLETGQWWTATSSGSDFTNALWTTWPV
jgi:hypothetical protein